MKRTGVFVNERGCMILIGKVSVQPPICTLLLLILLSMTAQCSRLCDRSQSGKTARRQDLARSGCSPRCGTSVQKVGLCFHRTLRSILTLKHRLSDVDFQNLIYCGYQASHLCHNRDCAWHVVAETASGNLSRNKCSMKVSKRSYWTVVLLIMFRSGCMCMRTLPALPFRG
jgi:hypothetical protein